VDDLSTDRKRRQQSRALQWLGRIRHRREPAVHATLPILRRRQLAIDRQVAQVAQGESE